MDYEYRAQILIIYGGYQGEAKDVIPKDDSWHPGVASGGPLTFEYYYTDSNSANNANSSRVTCKITDSWTAEFDDKNNLLVTVTTKVDSIIRGNIAGNPLAGGNWTRDIKAGRDANDVLWSLNQDNIGHAHTLVSNLDFGTTTITIPPGGEMVRGTVWIQNHTTGLAWPPASTDYTDEMWCGINFKNNREAIEPEPPFTIYDYRPGAIWDGSTWQSHNRNGGAANVFGAGSWIEMRTHYNGAEGVLQTTDPPFIQHTGTWYNMRNIGANHWPQGNPYQRN